MEAYKTVGIYGEGTAYILRNLGDWDEYEEFYVDEDGMYELILDVFYEEVP